MGLLNEGKLTSLPWVEIQKWSSHVKNSGIEQFINLYKRYRDRDGDPLKWGDEIEYLIIRFDPEKKRAQVSLRADQLLPLLRQPEYNDPESVKILWRPEFGSFMLEGCPGKPYDSGHLKQANIVEAHMKSRRKEVQLQLPPNEVLLSIANFPRLGCPGFTHPDFNPQPTSKSSLSESIFLPDEIVSTSHPRFYALAQNIRLRRGSKPAVHIPIFKDAETPSPFIEFGNPDAKPDFVYTDSMGFGTTCCAIQVTLQATNLGEARLLYDNLAPLCPILLAVTSAVPFFRGYLVDTDNRWGIISAAADDRTPFELGKIPKSRYDGIGCFLSKDGADYNDVPVAYQDEHYSKLLEGGVDPIMAQHIAHLFVRDPLVLYLEKVYQDNSKESDHFENLLSSNWQTMRLKAPCTFPEDCGWRVEVRPCEVQLTDFENAAIAYFILLLSRIIVTYRLCFLIPMSKLDENMIRAQGRDSVLHQKFWFRNIFNNNNKQEKSCCLMTVNEIVNGSKNFPGLIPLIRAYLNSANFDGDAESFHKLHQYLSLISKRANGEIKTTAAWLRHFITCHPAYKKDSVITDEINYDLLQRISRLQEDPDSALLGEFLCKRKTGLIK